MIKPVLFMSINQRFPTIVSRIIWPVLLLSLALQGCYMPSVSLIPVMHSDVVNEQEKVVGDRDGTATPTPFQPLPPTAVFTPTFTPEPSPTPLAPTATSQVSLPTPTPTRELVMLEGQVNILLLGSDQRPWDVNFRTDTVILATLNEQLGTVNLTSFPRDLWIRLPGYGEGRINTAYYFGGIDMLMKAFKENFDIRPDHYVLINFSSFKRVIDSLGGLDVTVTAELSDYRDGYWVNIPAGKVHMDADTVLWYVRSRKTTNDFSRTRRQQEVLLALFDRLLSLDAIRRLPDFYKAYKDSVSTDLSFTDLLTMVPLAIKLADDRSRLHHYYVGAKQVYNWLTPDGAMVLLPDPAAVQEVIRKSQNLP